MKEVEVSCIDCPLSNGSPCPTCNDEGLFTAYILDPHERVIDVERVGGLVKRLDEPPWSLESWQALKKELGIE